jgi:hypothetical protein
LYLNYLKTHLYLRKGEEEVEEGGEGIIKERESRGGGKEEDGCKKRNSLALELWGKYITYKEGEGWIYTNVQNTYSNHYLQIKSS